MSAKLVAITQSSLCSDFLAQIRTLCEAGVDAIILRQKELSAREYEALARQVFGVCAKHGTPCVLHHFYQVARKLGCEHFHFDFASFLQCLDAGVDFKFKSFGVSVHSQDELVLAFKNGADYGLYGHIFTSECKADLAPRGLLSLKKMCQIAREFKKQIYAVGGINAQNIVLLRDFDLAAVCLRSELMRAKAEDVMQLKAQLKF